MAIDTTKSKFSLQTASKEARSFPTISLTTPDEGTSNPEDAEVSNNPDASSRLKKLSSQGLNPLKPVIIANTEFVPVGAGSSPDSTGLKVQIGENNLLSVNSVTKLFEIHRQVRLATLKSANMLLKRVKGYDSRALLEELNKILRLYMEDLATDNMTRTVDNVINKIINFQASSSSNTATTSRSRSAGKIILKSKKESFSSQKFSLDSNFSNRNKLKTVFENNKNDPYLRTIVEYAILEFVVFDILKYMSGILSLKDAALKSWSVLESLNYGTISGINAENLNSSSKIIFENAFRSFSRSDMTQKSTAGLADDMLSNYTGIKAGSNTPDSSLLIQFFISAAENLIKMKSNYNEVINNENESPASTNVFPVINGDEYEVYDALVELSNAYATSLYSNLKITDQKGNEEDFDSFLDGDIPDANSFSSNRIEKIFESFPSNVNKIDALGQMLGALIFNDCFEIAGSVSANPDITKVFFAIGDSIPSGITNIEDYYNNLIGYSKTLERQNFEFSLDSTEINRRKRIVSYLSSKSTKSEDLGNYIPFESVASVGKIHNSSYLTGPEYFYDVAIQRGDDNLSELKSFVENYKNFANKYTSDIYNLTKIDFVEDAARQLLKAIGEEIDLSKTSGNGVFLLSLIAYQAGSDKGLLRLFRSAYFGSRLNSKAGKEGEKIGHGSTARPFENYGEVTAEEASRRAMRGANSILIKSLLKDGFDIDRSKIKDKKKKSFRAMSYGGELKGGIKPKEYTEKDKHFSNIKNGKTLNVGTGEANSRRITYTVHKQSGKKIDAPTGGLNKEEQVLEGGANFSTELAKTIKYFLDNQHFVDAGLITSNQKKSFNARRLDKTLTGKGIVFGVNYQGTGVSLADHHRAFILYSFVAKIIRKSVSVLASSADGGGANNAKVILTLNADEVEGVAQAFKDFGTGTTYAQIVGGDGGAKQAAYNNTSEHLSKFIESISRRVRKISALTATPQIHAIQLYNQYLFASKFISEGSGTNRDKLAIAVLKNDRIKAFDISLDLLSDEAVSQIYKSYVTTLLSGESSIYTKEDIPSLNQIKLMMKILTNPGYGLLSSEKRGPKNICHVGMTNSLMSTLRLEAYKEFNNRAFLESRRFCVNIFKRNEIDSQILVYPKTFLFDSSLMIIDNDFEGKNLNHISNFSDTWSFSDILNNIEFTTWSNKNNDLEDPFSNLKKAYSANYQKGSELKLRYGGDILRNHILDYAFKVYYRYALGLDLNENTFTLKPIRKNSEQISGGLSVKRNEIQADYENLINKTKVLYPAANIDQKLASELFRAIEIIAASPGYSLVDKLKKAIYPKKFDKVFSILVNEKDFVLYTPAYDKNFIDVYKTEPSFSYTSRTTRPDLKNVSSENEKIINKYNRECEEDFPEVFSMYATITILPDGTK